MSTTRLAVVTGGAGGIGRVIVDRLVADGVRVAVVDLVQADGLSNGASAFVADVSDASSVAAMAAQVRERLGEPAILVHAAALQFVRPFEEVDHTAWSAMMRVNVDGLFHLAQEFLPSMRRTGWGRVVAVTSSSLFAPNAGMVPYVTSKGALLGLVRSLAKEVGPDGVTVNAVAPGLTRTERSAADLPEELFHAVRERQSVKRTGEPQDTAAAVAFLASQEAGFITGQTLLVDGGESHV
ncbi:SDR family NAD(P)-dependent oxidoreductase [Nocardioides sp. NPDC101246]|uniref:SDR family NAD(P)-dependent oxidoreductase n=1 Tax=Nocardioides sp. NPDC101246 TaxID=3364336 RepID=UPI0038160705